MACIYLFSLCILKHLLLFLKSLPFLVYCWIRLNSTLVSETILSNFKLHSLESHKSMLSHLSVTSRGLLAARDHPSQCPRLCHLGWCVLPEGYSHDVLWNWLHLPLWRKVSNEQRKGVLYPMTLVETLWLCVDCTWCYACMAYLWFLVWVLPSDAMYLKWSSVSVWFKWCTVKHALYGVTLLLDQYYVTDIPTKLLYLVNT